jgi:hypothetical protein
MNAPPSIPVSWGELLDRISILEIKQERLQSPDARAAVRNEMAALRGMALAVEARTAVPRAGLLAVNTRLWWIEDALRAHEAAGDFGVGFVALARAVYRNNDERGRIKRMINLLLDSPWVEQKQYTAYQKS